MSKHDQMRKQVSAAYAEAINDNQGCCGSSNKGSVVSFAGYSVEQLKKLSLEVKSNAFGCGNPVAFGELQPGDVVLDLGSGAGIDLLLAAQKVGEQGRVIGVDMTDDMLAKAQKNIRDAGVKNIDLRKGIIEQLPVEDASVDWVISNCVINLSPEKERVFAEISRVLRPGGRMMVSDIVANKLPLWIRENAELYCSCVAGAISEKEYLDGLRSVGLSQVQVRDRLVYDADQLKGLFSSEDNQKSSCCGGNKTSSKALNEVAGQVASILVYAQKNR